MKKFKVDEQLVRAAKINQIEPDYAGVRGLQSGPLPYLLYLQDVGQIKVPYIYIVKYRPLTGGYYLKLDHGVESYASAEEFEAKYKSVEE